MSVKIVLPLTASFTDYPDDESIAVVIYFLGCDHSCLSCHNRELKSYNYEPSTEVNQDSLIDLVSGFALRNNTDKLVFEGGDPLSINNIKFIKKILPKLIDVYSITIYTGYEIDYIKEHNIQGFKFIKCGPYLSQYAQEPCKTETFMRLGSSNQKLYDSNYDLISKDGIYYFN